MIHKIEYILQIQSPLFEFGLAALCEYDVKFNEYRQYVHNFIIHLYTIKI